MTVLAFIGLGIMGGPMAANLVKAGYDVIGYDTNHSALASLQNLGGRSAGSIAQAVTDADVVITMLPDSPDVQAVALGEEGIYANARAGTLHIDCSSIRPDIAQQLARRATDLGLRAVDAPVSGGEVGAIEALLSIMVGGQPDDVSEAQQILQHVGSTIVHVGPHGAGQTVKAANQLIVAGTIQLVAEAIVFLEAYGVDTTAAVKVLAGGLAGNAILDRKVTSMLQRDFTPGFRIDLHHKDMGILTSAARDAGVIIPLGSHVAQLIASLRASGHGQLDHTALLLLVERLSGRDLQSAKV
ncbi:2-hydroxy-3-oxopropionate reductase [Nonomuraea recticatena]|uniref:2-hydroxy-3-oxopropionate reductase n=1 Tax=Nonomuraea recticatena TaxID=46178 RepID=A0ABP6FU87_9ACTN